MSTHDSKAVVEMVKEQKERIRRANYAEKLDKDFTPFISMSQVDDIENAFWEHGKTSARESFPGIRNRFVFLQCYAAVLRHESMFLGELSDMFGFEHKRPKDPDPLYIMVMQIATGKFFCCFLLVFASLLYSTHSLSSAPQVRRLRIARSNLVEALGTRK